MRLLPTVIVLVLALAAPCAGSDHADPIDVKRWRPLEPVITDLFVFPVDGERRLVEGESRGADIAGLAIILCVRRGLTDESLDLHPYTYKVHIDTTSTVTFPSDPGDLSVARYGGRIPAPDSIAADAEIAVTLNDDASLARWASTGLERSKDVPLPVTGIFADPFNFPMFHRSNVVGIVLHVPMTCFRGTPDTFVVWATSHKGRRQIDHVGRSLRTQNPRFDLLNTLPPHEHVPALVREHEHPSLMRDVFLRINLNGLFAYRAWDFVPDVLIYAPDRAVGFPNGRRLDDDVVALTAQYGDSLAYDLSYFEHGHRATSNVAVRFRDTPPYLAPPHTDPEFAAPHALSWRNKLKIATVAVVVLLVLWLLHLWLRNRYHRKQLRLRYQ